MVREDSSSKNYKQKTDNYFNDGYAGINICSYFILSKKSPGEDDLILLFFAKFSASLSPVIKIAFSSRDKDKK